MKLIERIAHFPVSFYSVIMGLLGFVIAIEKAHDIFHVSSFVPMALIIFSAIIFCAISVALVLKIVLYKEVFIKDFQHPIKISFFPTFSISLLLLSVALLPIHSFLSFIFWVLGSGSHLIFTFLVIGQWIKKYHYKIEHLSPAWFIPVVGNLLVPIAGTAFVSKELLWFFFSVGIVFWLVLMTIVIYRLFFHEPLPGKILPTMFILIAPPAIGCISYFKLTNQIDSFSRILYYFSFFIALLLISNMRMFISKNFYLSQWAFTFPLAAISIASALMFHETKIVFFMYVHLAFLLLDAAIIAVLIYKTGHAVYSHKICHEES